MERVAKVLVYATRHDDELLVFEQPDDPVGVQVPGGTVEPAESLSVAAVRELQEEAGVVPEALAPLGSVERPHPHREEVHERHFFHARVDEPRDRWVHVGGGTGEDAGRRFVCYWLSIREAVDALGRDQEAYLDALT
ncbi:NUDIX hydrolase [Halorarius litoreus]|uniref:NUDIX hydrolase n=1 Tax=Halorarius litoreus TaxID=2962676 RepID=UPI0020CB989E|nr:NUDIX domain-containing protein [Halorarius litoreus]